MVGIQADSLRKKEKDVFITVRVVRQQLVLMVN